MLVAYRDIGNNSDITIIVNMMYKFVLLFSIFYMSSSFTLGLADFVPNFLNKSIAPESTVKSPSPIFKKNSKANIVPDCKNQYDRPNVFCFGTESSIYNDNDSFDDNFSGDSNLANQSKSYAMPEMNQKSLQKPDANTQSSMPQTLLNNLSVPIQPSKNLNLNISPQQIELNIKY